MALKYLEKEFDMGMWDIYKRAKVEVDYYAPRFLQMLPLCTLCLYDKWKQGAL